MLIILRIVVVCLVLQYLFTLYSSVQSFYEMNDYSGANCMYKDWETRVPISTVNEILLTTHCITADEWPLFFNIAAPQSITTLRREVPTKIYHCSLFSSTGCYQAYQLLPRRATHTLMNVWPDSFDLKYIYLHSLQPETITYYHPK